MSADIHLQTCFSADLVSVAILLNTSKCYFLWSYSPYYALLCSVSVWPLGQELFTLFAGRLQKRNILLLISYYFYMPKYVSNNNDN